MKVFFVYTLSLSILSITSLTLIGIGEKVAYFFVLKVYTIVEYFLFGIMYYCFLNNKWIRLFLLLSFLPFLLSSLFFYTEPKFSNYPLLIEFLIFIILIIVFFFEKMVKTISDPIYLNTTFWISVALFFYFTGNFFFLLLSQVNSNPAFNFQLLVVCSIVTILKNILLSIGFIFSQEPSPKNNSDSFPKDLNLDMF